MMTLPTNTIIRVHRLVKEFLEQFTKVLDFNSFTKHNINESSISIGIRTEGNQTESVAFKVFKRSHEKLVNESIISSILGQHGKQFF